MPFFVFDDGRKLNDFCRHAASLLSPFTKLRPHEYAVGSSKNEMQMKITADPLNQDQNSLPATHQQASIHHFNCTEVVIISRLKQKHRRYAVLTMTSQRDVYFCLHVVSLR